MDKQTTSGDAGAFLLEVGLEFHKTIDYDRRAMRKALRNGGKHIINESRRLVSRRAISGAGEMPGMVTGRMKRSIGKVTGGTKGGWIKLGPRSFKDRDIPFYPAFLHHGSESTNLAPRANFMTQALENKRDAVRGEIRAALRDALVPR